MRGHFTITGARRGLLFSETEHICYLKHSLPRRSDLAHPSSLAPHPRAHSPTVLGTRFGAASTSSRERWRGLHSLILAMVLPGTDQHLARCLLVVGHDPYSRSQLAQLSLTPLLQLSLTHLLQLLRYALPFLYEPFLQVRCRRHFALSRKSLREFRSLDCTPLLVSCSPRLSQNGRQKPERIR